MNNTQRLERIKSEIQRAIKGLEYQARLAFTAGHLSLTREILVKIESWESLVAEVNETLAKFPADISVKKPQRRAA